MPHVIIAASPSLARTYAIIDWGWTLASHTPLTFRNEKQELVEYIPMNAVYSLRDKDGGKLYYVMDGLQRFQDSLPELASHMRSTRWYVMRHMNET